MINAYLNRIEYNITIGVLIEIDTFSMIKNFIVFMINVGDRNNFVTIEVSIVSNNEAIAQ